jgi:transposase-like protein
MLEIFESLNAQDSDSVRQVLETLYNGAMKIERESHLGVASHERSEDRRGYANGYKNKTLKTRIGELELNVPQTRDTEFYPACLEKGCRSERALKLAVAEMYLKGVSTRKVAAITKKLCGLDISSTQVSAMTRELDTEFGAFRERPLGEFPYVYLDATYLKVRHSGSVISVATLIAYGVNADGKREILGVSSKLSEAEVHWRGFLEELQRRGLRGVRLIISDDHAGLGAALRAVYPAVPWQRCQFHILQNAQHYAPKKSMREEIVDAVRSVFHCTTRVAAEEAKRRVIEKFSEDAPEFVKWFEANIDEGLTCLEFPESHRKRLRTTNGLERVNREVKRRTRVAVLFPNTESALRLVTGVLMEIHEEWVTGIAYLDMSKLFDRKNTK